MHNPITGATRGGSQTGGKAASRQRGSVAIWMGLTITSLTGFAALGSEVTYLIYKHRQMQTVADAAAVSAVAAKLQGADPVSEATAVAGQLKFANGVSSVTVVVNNPPASGAYTSNNNAVEVLVSQPQTMGLMGVLSSKIVPVSTRAVATLAAASKFCVLALSATAEEAVHLDNNAAMTSRTCGVAVNSSSQNALHLDNNAYINGPVSVVGNWDLDNGAKINGTPKASNALPITNPYASIQSTPATPATCSDVTKIQNYCSAQCTLSIPVGHYCGWSGFDNDVTINLSAGTYFIDGDLITKNNFTLNATAGSTIIMTDSDSKVEIKNNATLNITAPTTGTYAGIALMSLSHEDQEFENNAVINIIGAIYFPNAAAHFSNNDLIGAETCTQIIAKKLHFENNVALDSSSCLPSKQMVLSRGQLVE
jgi:hypothetical protein